MKRIIFTFLFLLIPTVTVADFSFAPFFGAGGSLNTLDQWTSTTSPSSAITQRTFGKSIKLTGLSTGTCLSLTANNILTTTTCGSGGGGLGWASTTVPNSNSIYSTALSNVGIGTTSPYAKLSVAGQVVGAYFTATSSTASTLTGGLLTNTINPVGSANLTIGGANAGNIVIMQSNSDTSSITLDSVTEDINFLSANGAVRFTSVANGVVAGSFSASSITDSGLSSGKCVQAGVGGLLATVASACSTLTGGGANGNVTLWNSPSQLGNDLDFTWASASGKITIGVSNIGTTNSTTTNLGITGLTQGWLSTSGLSGASITSSTSPTVNYIFATSTSKASTFPYASTTALSISGLTSGNCVQASTGGLLTTVASACGAGGGVSGGTAGMLTSWIDSTTLTATSAPTARYYFATSTTATSTLAGSLLIGSTTVFSTNVGNPITIIENKKINLYTTKYIGGLRISGINGNDSTSANTNTSGLFLGQENQTASFNGSGFIQQYTSAVAGELSLNPNGGGVVINGIGAAGVDANTALSVVGNSGQNAYLKVNSLQTGGYTGVIFRGYSDITANNYAKAGILFNNTDTCGNYCRGDMHFLLDPNASNANVQDNVNADTVMLLKYTNMSVGIGTTSPYSKLSVAGQVVGQNFVATSTTATSTFSGPIQLGSTGTSPAVGNATLVGGTKTVTTGAATTNSFVLLTRKTSGGTIGTAITYTITNGSFTINSDNPLDTSTFTWVIF